ncbi:ABC-type glycerol-3-phosphate transport system, permease component [Gracilibacillus halophilus YIM-C55.5]|uniref:ABC-type glycerol-3-phosphate transport system, permease component n=1 Tax=Gracilibacillus halophilus YIM-C55.5 TaxID=1308866 RepID=N4WRY4_9BACI|nr:ABC-type glycerol-3-phosphate transport system, permease component [Gracilibacillus halophilus YIM-C55.5]
MNLPRMVLTYGLLTLAAIMVVFPIIYAFLISFMSGAELLQGKLLPASFHFDNYQKAFERLPLAHYLWNSFFVSTVVMIGQLIVSALAAFAFVFVPFKGRNVLFFIFISTMMIPWEATMIPNFLTIQQLDWVNQYEALTIPFFAIAFGTFLLRQHFKTVPNELKEASDLAGLTSFTFFWKVVIPYCRTSFVTLGLIVS